MTTRRDEIPKQKHVDQLPLLRGYVYFSEMDFEVDFLIRSDVPDVLQRREVIPATGGGPYLTKVELGWVINGATGRKPKYFPSACYFTKSVEVHPLCVTSADFVYASSTDGPGLSHDDDLKLMNSVQISVTQCKDGHISMEVYWQQV